MVKRLRLQLEQLRAAIADFELSLSIDSTVLEPVLGDAVRAGQAQKFEFVVELFWKTIKQFLEQVHGFDLASPKPIGKKYFELGHMDYQALDRGLRALEIRNSLGHIYRKETFLTLHTEIVSYKGYFAQATAEMGKAF